MNRRTPRGLAALLLFLLTFIATAGCYNLFPGAHERLDCPNGPSTLADTPCGPTVTDWKAPIIAYGRLAVTNMSRLHFTKDALELPPTHYKIDLANRTISLGGIIPANESPSVLEVREIGTGNLSLFLFLKAAWFDRAIIPENRSSTFPTGHTGIFWVKPSDIFMETFYNATCPRVVQIMDGAPAQRNGTLWGSFHVFPLGQAEIDFQGQPDSPCEPGTMLLEAGGTLRFIPASAAPT